MKLTLPVRRFVSRGEEQIVRRALSQSGKITARPGVRISPEDILGETSVSVGFRSLPIAEILKVHSKDVQKYLLKKVGDKVFMGELLARKQGFFGRKKEVTSPTSGTIVEIDGRGNLNVEFRRETQKLVAGVWGVVESVQDQKAVDIKTRVSEIVGICGAGRMREGILNVMCGPEEFLLPQTIDQKLSGSIIFGGALVSREALSKAVAVGVSGIIAGGMHARDFWEAGGAHGSAYWTSSDVGVTLVILQGFGLVAPPQEMFNFLKENEGRFAVIDGDSATVTIPSKEEKGVKKAVIPKEKELAVGDQVRVLDASHFGEVGAVASISKETEMIFAHETVLIAVETSHGKIKIPYQNLEIVI